MSSKETTKMSRNSVLVMWTKTKQTSVVPEESFAKKFSESGQEIPVCEGVVRTVTVADKPYEAKVLRISASKKFLDSLLVTKDGKVLMHGTKPSTCDLLAKRSKLFSDESAEQKKERKVFRNLSRNTEEQQPNIRLPSSGCSHGCPSCCSGTLPPFPTIPEGFISTVVSLAQYFQQFHRSTIANIIAAGHSIDKGQPEPWRVKSEGKMEVILGSGIWINSKVFERILLQVDSSKKPPHQTLVKNLLTHLLGVEKYIETPAEKMDKRLLSAVIEFVNERYGETTQSFDRFNRCINLNRAYMQKRKNEGLLDDSYFTAKYFEGITKFEGTREERNKLLSELEAKRARKSTIPTVDLSPRVYGTAPLHGENSEDVQVPAANTANKIIVVRRPVTTLSSFENIQQGPVVVSANYQTSSTSDNSQPTFANRSLYASGSRSILVQSSQAPTNLIAVTQAVTQDRPIGTMAQMMSVKSSAVSVGSVRSLPTQIQPNQMTNSITALKSGMLTPSNSPRPVTAAPRRPVITVPHRSRVLTAQQVPTSKGLITFTPTQRALTAGSTTSPSLASTKGRAMSSPAGPSIQIIRPQSAPVRVSGPSQSRLVKAASPDIIEILDESQVLAPPRKTVKLEDNLEIEGALNFEL